MKFCGIKINAQHLLALGVIGAVISAGTIPLAGLVLAGATYGVSALIQPNPTEKHTFFIDDTQLRSHGGYREVDGDTVVYNDPLSKTYWNAAHFADTLITKAHEKGKDCEITIVPRSRSQQKTFNFPIKETEETKETYKLNNRAMHDYLMEHYLCSTKSGCLEVTAKSPEDSGILKKEFYSYLRDISENVMHRKFCLFSSSLEFSDSQETGGREKKHLKPECFHFVYNKDHSVELVGYDIYAGHSEGFLGSETLISHN